MKLERIGTLLLMAPLIKRATLSFRDFGTAAELIVDLKDLAPDMQDIATPFEGRYLLKVTDFYDALSERYEKELSVLNMVDPLPRRKDEGEKLPE